MVAPANPHYRLLPPADYDPGEPLNLAYNPSDPVKLYEVKKAGEIRHSQSGRRLREYVLKDKNHNLWIAYLAYCLDGEVYQWPQGRDAYIKPSIIANHGGLTADLFDKYRVQAFRAFARIDAQVRQLRNIASKTAGRIIDGAKLDISDLPPAPDLSAKPAKTVQLGNPEAHAK